MTELAEGARLEIVYTPQAYLGFESPSLRQIHSRQPFRLPLLYDRQSRSHPKRRGGRVVECGGLENRFTRIPGDEGSNPSSSASKVKARVARAFLLPSQPQWIRTDEVEFR